MRSQSESTIPQRFLVNGKTIVCSQCRHDRFIGPEETGERHVGVQCAICAHMEIFGVTAKRIQPFATTTTRRAVPSPKPKLVDVLTKILDEHHLSPFGLVFENGRVKSPERNLRVFLGLQEVQCLRDEIERLQQCGTKPIDVR
jgi:hypothetical protein